MDHEQPKYAVTKGRLEGDAGANLVEYAMLVALIFVVALGAVQYFGNNASKKMSCASSAVANTSGGIVC